MLRWFARFARPHLPRYAAGFLLLLVTNGFGLWLPWLLRDAIRALEQAEALAVVSRIALLMIGVAVAQAVVRTCSRLTILGASRHIVADVRVRFFERLQRLGPAFYDRQRTGDVMSRGVNDVQLLQSFYGPGLMNLLNTVIVYLSVLVLLLRIEAQLTLIALAVYPLLFLGVNRISRHVYARSVAVQEQLGELSNRVQESISGIQQVKIYAQEAREAESFGALADEYRKRNLSMAAVRGAMVALIGVGAGVGSLIVLFVGGRFVIQGRMSFPDFVAFNAYLAMLAWPTIALGWIVNVFQRGAGAMRRICEVLEREPDIAPPAAGDDARERAFRPLAGDVEFRGLDFAYPAGGDAARSVLHDVHLRIPAGSRVAFVGAVGSGKSTLVQLLARFYPVPTGTVFVGGEDVTAIPTERLRRSIGYVPQEAFLFSRTLRENVTLGHPAAEPDEVARAIELAHLTGDLAAFPDGLETVVGERGFTLSGGQRQRATLARAMLGERSILILDDSLSSVDADTERAILEELRGHAAGRTLILISHRLSTLSEVDRIVVLDEGRVVEDGTHDELLRSKGVYAGLFQRYLLEQRLQ